MKFEEALVLMREGKEVKRKGLTRDIYYYNADAQMIYCRQTESATILELYELLTSEWEQHEEHGLKFEDVLPALREGKKIRCKDWSKDRSAALIKDGQKNFICIYKCGEEKPFRMSDHDFYWFLTYIVDSQWEILE